jgi:hypothetical protein
MPTEPAKPYLYHYVARLSFTADTILTSSQVSNLLEPLLRIYLEGYQRNSVEVKHMEVLRYAKQPPQSLNPGDRT